MKHLLALIITISTLNVYSQNIVAIKPEKPEFTEAEWEKIQKKWDIMQPSADVILITGDTIRGQLIYANNETIIIYPSNELMINPDQFDDMVRIPINDIDRVILLKMKEGSNTAGMVTGMVIVGAAGVITGLLISDGWSLIPAIALGAGGIALGGWVGSKIQKAKRNSTVILNTNAKKNKINKFQNLSIYNDTVFYQDINQMREHSKIMRQAFPKKRFRIYFGLNAGSSATTKALIEPHNSTDRPTIKEHDYTIMYFDFFNISWRFANRYIVGWNYFKSRDDYTLIYYNDPTGETKKSYHYYNNANGTILYLDYVIKPITKYFTKKTEFSVGAGLLHLKPDVHYIYNSWDNLKNNNEYFQKEYSIYGLQLRTAAFYYIFPGMSISVGLQGNIYQNITINSGIVNLPEHTLKFSSIRATFGIGFYL